MYIGYEQEMKISSDFMSEIHDFNSLDDDRKLMREKLMDFNYFQLFLDTHTHITIKNYD